MDKTKKGLRPGVKRRLIQLYSALLYNAHLKGFISGSIYEGSTKLFCTPGLNCYSCPAAAGACPLGALQASLASSGRHAGYYIIGILLLYSLLLGRTVCGWLCPFGLIQELLYKIPSPKLKKSRVTRTLSYIKYIILAVLVIAVPLWYGLKHDPALPAFCKFICPAGTLEGALPLLAHPANKRLYSALGYLFALKLAIMTAAVIICVFCFRAFCRFMCPLGALYGLFCRFSVIGVKTAPSCTGCGACVRACKMDVQHVGDRECIHCAQCSAVCPTGAISLKADIPSVPVKAARPAAIIAASALLAAALIYCNFYNTANDTDTAAASAEKGVVLENFTVKCFDGSVFELYKNRGKVTVINLWATYCGPCVKELPYFNSLYHAHEGDIAVIAVHSNLTTEDVAAFVADKGWDIKFAADNENEDISAVINGSSALPQTVVLNRRGEVIYNRVGSVTPELLEQLYAEAAK